jgi:integron integrase
LRLDRAFHPFPSTATSEGNGRSGDHAVSYAFGEDWRCIGSDTSALLFLYQKVLKQEVGWIDQVERAKRPKRIPVVLTRDEVHKIFAHMHGMPRLMAGLLYGSGLRLMECVRLRVKDVDFGYARITVRDGKGAKDRITMLPVNLAASLERHLAKVKAQHEQDLEDGFGEVYLPGALDKKYRGAPRSWAWQFIFPSSRISLDPRTGARRRHHVDENVLQVAVKRAVRASGVSKRATCHTLRHSFATIYWKTDTTSARCKSCWGTRM